MQNSIKAKLSIIIISACILLSSSCKKNKIYTDSSLSAENRAKALLKLMTVEEKIAQTMCIWESEADLVLDENGKPSAEKIAKNFPNGIGQIGRPSSLKNKLNAREMAEFTNRLQEIFLRQSRLGIPVIFHEETLHGHVALDGTSFPQPIALASSFDTELVEQLYSMAAKEIRVRGGHQVLTPVVDVAREPRWGRVEETFGEDPYLVSKMGMAAVKGLQGDATFKNNDKVIATLKHFAAHGQPEAGTNCGPVNVSERVLREIFFPPFKNCISEVGALSVMASYNEIDGIPSHANKWLLKDILRTEWGFDGVVVSDYYAITELYQKDYNWGNWVAKNKEEAAKLAFDAGVNIELPRHDCYLSLTDLFEQGEISMEEIDALVFPLIKQKFQIGIFDAPFVKPEIADEIVANKNSRTLAEEAALKSITLLENDGILPLDRAKLKTIAVIGPNADRSLLGGYSGWPKHDITLLEGIKQQVGSSLKVYYAEGCKITTTSGIDKKGNKIPSANGWNTSEVGLPTVQQDNQLIKEAVTTARQADVIILAVGGNEQTSRESWAYNHMGDRASLELFGRQMELYNSLKALNKPIIVVLNNGRPLQINELTQSANAILECWYLGQESGHAITKVIFGDYNPGGKLPISFPRSVGHIPAYYNHKPFDRRGYLHDNITALYPFGYGLSYTTFELSSPTLSSVEINKGSSVSVSIDIENTGKFSGEEVVQLYIRDKVSSVTRPVKELKDFRRVSLEPGEKRTIVFELGPDSFSFYDINMNYVTESGEFIIMVGNSSINLKEAVLMVK